MNKPIRILHVVTHMNRGGLETMIMNYYRNIDRTKFQFDFLTHRDEEKDYDSEIFELGGTIYHLPVLNPFSVNYRSELKRFFSVHNNYDIVHSHLDCMSALPLNAAKEAGVINLIAHSHNTSQEKNLKYLIKMFYKKKLPSTASRLLACGDEAGKWMFGQSEYTIMNNAIDLELFKFSAASRNKIRNEHNLDDSIVIGHVGRFNEQKNHSFIVDIFQSVLKYKPNAKLLLLGDGDLLDSIVKKAEDLSIVNNVIIAGKVSNVHEFMSAMDIFLFPSLFEGLPLTLVEAQMSGVKCLVSDIITDEISLSDGFYKKSLNDSPEEWAKELVKLTTQGGCSREYDQRLLKYDIHCNVQKVSSMYEEMVKENHG